MTHRLPKKLIALSAARYTKRPKVSVAQQVCDYLKKFGASRPGEVRHGIAKNTEAARYIVGDVSCVLVSLFRNGHATREKSDRGYIYSLESRSADTRHRNSKNKGHRAAAKLSPKLKELAKRTKADIRDDVLAEMFLRVSLGMFDPADMAGLLRVSVQHVNKELRGGWRENFSTDMPLTETGFTLLDVLTDTPVDYDMTKLTMVETRVDEINERIQNGFQHHQIEHLWSATPSMWPKF